MNSDELRKLQAPLKQKYKEDAQSALITLKARGQIGKGLTCRLETGKALVEAGLHPATGGNGLIGKIHHGNFSGLSASY